MKIATELAELLDCLPCRIQGVVVDHQYLSGPLPALPVSDLHGMD
jgi:hypothetical protein